MKGTYQYKKRKRTLRAVALLLTLILSLLSLPLSAVAMEEMPDSEEVIQNETVATNGITEIVALREENVKHFKMPDGTYQAVSYGSAVHRKDDSGAWQDIDNRLTLQSKGATSVFVASDQRTAFSQSYRAGQPLFTLQENAYALSMSFAPTTIEAEELHVNATATAQAVVNNAPLRAQNGSWETIEEAARVDHRTKVVYASVLPSTDLEYVLNGNNVKENIIIHAPGNHYSYPFILEASGLIATLSGTQVLLSDAQSGEVKYCIPAPYMYDADGNVSYDVFYTLTELGGGRYELKVTADADWINAEDRTFPVTVDPTIVTLSSNVQDTYIKSSAPSTNYSQDEQLWVGNVHTSLVKMNLPAIPPGATINYAMLHAYYYYNVNTGSMTVGAYQILQDFSMSTVTWYTANAYTNLGIDTTRLGYAILYASASIREPTPGEAQFEITDAVEHWYDNPTENYGIALRYDSGSNYSVILKSNEAGDGHAPYIRVAYTHYLPDGVYALQSAYNFMRFMTVEENSKTAGSAIQQKAITGDHPALTFDRASLFKIIRVSGTDNYIIRYMRNETLSPSVSGSAVTTKAINTVDVSVSTMDRYKITWAGDGYYFEHCGSGKLLNLVNTSTANLNAVSLEDATSKTVWYPLECAFYERAFFLKNVSTGHYAVTRGDASASGTLIEQQPLKNLNSIAWVIHSTQTISGKTYYRLKPETYTGYLGVNSSNTSEIGLYSTENDYTLWRISLTSSGNFRLTCKALDTTGKVLAVPSGGSTATGVALTYSNYYNNQDYYDEWTLNFRSAYGYREYWELAAYVPEVIPLVADCMGYAMNMEYDSNGHDWLQSLLTELEDPECEVSEIETDANLRFQDWLNGMGREQYVDWVQIDANTPIEETQYRIVLRFGKDAEFVVGNTYEWDYHFWYQTASGRWAHKNGNSASELLPSSVTPETSGTSGWRLGDKVDFYDSQIFYYAITLKPRETP